MITLYTIPGSSATPPRIALDEAGADYELVQVERDEAGNNISPSGYDALNPMATVPTLVDGDLVLTEAAACCLYIAEKYPDAHLMPPAGSDDWAQTLRWLTLLTNTAQASFLRWYYPEHYTADADGLEAVQAASVAELARVAEVLAAQIGDGPFLLGAQFTVADAFLATLTGWSADLSAGCRWPENPAIAAHYNAVAQREAAGRALIAEGFPATFAA
ncbi:MAG: glutathione S-transferase family protein [Solirubrobacteraceae bacterium]|jgi:glutathione S-transferase|nr:glutathione S-transferase family protein [Solirubrobacteraceae bacterium]MDP4673079.1 glutathione S-transferase family protein [Solirubrobacteraceae bacterium]